MKFRILHGRNRVISRIATLRFFQAQDECVHNSKISGTGVRRHAWISKELMKKIEREEEKTDSGSYFHHVVASIHG